MAQVEATTERIVAADAETVFDTLADYSGTRAKLLPEQFSEYEVREGGDGEGTLVHWKLQATSKRVRDCLLEVTEPSDGELVEKDRNSRASPASSSPPPGRVPGASAASSRRRSRPRGSAASTTRCWPGSPPRSRSSQDPFVEGGLAPSPVRVIPRRAPHTP
jgi:hypothetical protein